MWASLFQGDDFGTALAAAAFRLQRSGLRHEPFAQVPDRIGDCGNGLRVRFQPLQKELRLHARIVACSGWRDAAMWKVRIGIQGGERTFPMRCRSAGSPATAMVLQPSAGMRSQMVRDWWDRTRERAVTRRDIPIFNEKTDLMAARRGIEPLFPG